MGSDKNVESFPSIQYGTCMFSDKTMLNLAHPSGESTKCYSCGTTVLSSMSTSASDGITALYYSPVTYFGTIVLSSTVTSVHYAVYPSCCPYISCAYDHLHCKRPFTHVRSIPPAFCSLDHSISWMSCYLRRKRSFIILKLFITQGTYRKHDFLALIYGLYGVSLRNSDHVVLLVAINIYMTIFEIQTLLLLLILSIYIMNCTVFLMNLENSLSTSYRSLIIQVKYYSGLIAAYYCSLCDHSKFYGGRAIAKRIVKGSKLMPFISSTCQLTVNYDDEDFQFVEYIPVEDVTAYLKVDNNLVAFNLPLTQLAEFLSRKELSNLATMHGLKVRGKDNINVLSEKFHGHECKVCPKYISLFRACNADGIRKANARDRQQKRRAKQKNHESHADPVQMAMPKFPPSPPSQELLEKIVEGFCNNTNPSLIEEAGCAVCGQLHPLSNLKPLSPASDYNFTLLEQPAVTRAERISVSQEVRAMDGPVLDRTCTRICLACECSLLSKKRPKLALANGLWIGDVPDVLKDLTFAERMMIARIRHNRCVVRVSSGRAKMVANCIMFSNPTVKVYNKLPPSREEMTEVLAFIFTGSAQPTENDFKRTPMLVRREKVSAALDWLMLNHCDYRDLEKSTENLNSYPLAGVPVVVNYKRTDTEDTNKLATAMSVHDVELEAGTEDGPCAFTVHGLTGDEFTKLSMNALKARALRHLETQGKTLGIGHEDQPQSMYDNPQAYPQMFPWLFPYGYGGLGQPLHRRLLSEKEHKHWLLMYHDKRFQQDLYFPIIAFNHEQMKSGITGSFLLAKRQNFESISLRLQTLDKEVLSNVTERLAKGENVRPVTDKEKACFEVLQILDHVGGYVKGSLTSKKYMRNQIWSLISFLGAPSWFITLSPADNRHPICLYFADTCETFSPEIHSSSERNRLIASNPVAAARFFDLMVRSFIKNVLGVDQAHPGLYGNTSGYYGTVEQQGRLTLHLHLLLWIHGALSLQEIRDRLMSEDSEFQHELTEYLDSVHQGDFITGNMDFVRSSVPVIPEPQGGIHAMLPRDQPGPLPNNDYKDPTMTLPVPPPLRCIGCTTDRCDTCQTGSWWQTFRKTVDDIVLKSNVH